MKLSTKAILILVPMTAVLILSLLLVSEQVVRKSFVRLEDQYARENVHRGLEALQDRVRQLDRLADDWASWDDAYKFVQDRNEAFSLSNINAETLKSLKIDFLLITDTEGRQVGGIACDPKDGRTKPVPEALVRMAGPKKPLQGGRSGVAMVDSQPVLVGVRPVLTSQKEGPARGLVIMGYFLDGDRIGEISASLHLPITCMASAAAQASEAAPVLQSLELGSPEEIRVGPDNRLAGYGLVRDLENRPALLLQVRMARDIYEQGERTSSLFAWMLALVGGVFCLASIAILRWQILARLERLGHGMNAIAAAEDFSQRLAVQGNDELATLARNANRLLEAVVESRQALVASEERFRQIAENEVDCIWEVDLAGLYVYASPAAEQIFGYRPDELVGRLHFYDLLEPRERPGLVPRLLAAMSRGRQARKLRHVNRRKDGRTVILETNAVPVRDARGVLSGYRGTERDVTELQRTEEELRQYRERLETLVRQRTAELAEAKEQADAANRAKSTFLSNVSGEFRTPLQSVISVSQVLSQDPLISSTQKSNIETVLRKSEHLLELIDNVLEITRAEAGRTGMDPRDFDLPALVGEVVESMRGRAEAKGLRLSCELDSGLPQVVCADPGKFRQVLAILLGNAIRFTQEGGVRLRISASRDPGRLRLAVEVADTGIGIAKEDQDGLFAPFRSSADSQTPRLGPGLGLAVACLYVQLMGGTISVDSEPNQGSCFRFTIPFRPPRVDGRPLPGRKIVGIETPVGELRIQLVDGHGDLLDPLGSLLGKMGFQIREADDMQEGVRQFLLWGPHLVFVGHRQAGLDGPEFARRLRQMPGGREAGVIAVMPPAGPEERWRMLEAGYDDVLDKPVQEAALFAALERLLNLRMVYQDSAGDGSHANTPT